MEDDPLFKKLIVGARFSQNTIKKQNKRLPKVDAATLKEETVDMLDFFAQDPRKNKETNTNSKTDRKTSFKPFTPLPIKSSGKPVFKNEERMHVFRKKKFIKVYGKNVADPIKKFKHLSMNVLLKSFFTQMIQLRKPTPVQMQAPSVLLTGRDALVVAPTGSGKTLSYIIPCLDRVLCLSGRKEDRGNVAVDGSVALIIAPTRELALQIKQQFRRFTPNILAENGKPIISTVLLNKTTLFSWKAKAPTNPPSIIISTPKRMIQAIEAKVLSLSTLKIIVLDEADKLLDGNSFLSQMDTILQHLSALPQFIQKALFSATIPSGIEDLAKTFLSSDPIRIVVGEPNAAHKKIQQELLFVGQEEGKLMAIRQMLTTGITPPVIIFTETIVRAKALWKELSDNGIFKVGIIHSTLSHSQRESTIKQFMDGTLWFLITTELLARGLDFPSVASVINYDFPTNSASYIHRIGRTGRAGQKGKAITFFTKDDQDHLYIVVNVMKQSGIQIEPWMQDLVLQKKKKKPAKKVNNKNVNKLINK